VSTANMYLEYGPEIYSAKSAGFQNT
jgi:hypothetical protein